MTPLETFPLLTTLNRLVFLGAFDAKFSSLNVKVPEIMDEKDK